MLWLAAIAVPVRARADDTSSPPLGADQIQFAAHEHDLGYRAYTAKMYDEAATHFENAFFAAPNPAELRYAIRARRDAGEPARAATLAAIGQRKFPADAPTSKLAEQVIAEARPSVYEVRVDSEAECNVAVDEKIVAIEKVKTFRFFVTPGKHELRISWSDDRTKTVPVDAKAGASQTLEVEPPPAPPPPPSLVVPVPPPSPPAVVTLPPPTAVPEAPAAAAGRPLPPLVFAAGAAVTAVGLGVTIWSGIDTENNPGKNAVIANCGGKTESCPDYQRGIMAQVRTNVLIAATSAVAAATAVVGVFFTRWSSGAQPSSRAAHGVDVEPVFGVAQAGLRGTF
jgi:hypothetical protein